MPGFSFTATGFPPTGAAVRDSPALDPSSRIAVMPLSDVRAVSVAAPAVSSVHQSAVRFSASSHFASFPGSCSFSNLSRAATTGV